MPARERESLVAAGLGRLEREMDRGRIETTAEMLAGLAFGSDDPDRCATEMIDALADDPRWAPADVAAVRTTVEQRLLSGVAPTAIIVVA